jgi:hypothetical protein
LILAHEGSMFAIVKQSQVKIRAEVLDAEDGGLP